MRALGCVVFCLTYAGQGWRVHASSKQTQTRSFHNLQQLGEEIDRAYSCISSLGFEQLRSIDRAETSNPLKVLSELLLQVHARFLAFNDPATGWTMAGRGFRSALIKDNGYPAVLMRHKNLVQMMAVDVYKVSDPPAKTDHQSGGIGHGRTVIFFPPRGNLLPVVEARREVKVWLPPGYDKDINRRYPLVFCHDGQNMMEKDESWLGVSWELGKATSDLLVLGRIVSPIFVLIPNLDRLRYIEYEFGPLCQNFVNWMADTLKPALDSEFRTKSQKAYALGSSLGGTCSFLSCYWRPDVFTAAACLSPSFNTMLIADVAMNRHFWRANKCRLTRLYLDNGGNSEDGEVTVPVVDWENSRLGLPPDFTKGFFWLDTQLQLGVDGMLWALHSQGMDPDGERLMYDKFPGDAHNEVAWARRVYKALIFLLGKEHTKPVEQRMPR